MKSFITSPSPGLSLKEPGVYEISGIAYSGTGRIAKVLVSADGGKSWAEAALDEPRLPKAFTRFRMAWRWDGGPAILHSRAWDESGAVQPPRADSSRCAARPRRCRTCSAFPTSTTTPHRWGVDSRGRSSMSMRKPRAVAALVALAFASAALAAESPQLGKPISEADIKAWDINVLPDGTNLPPGSGTAADGAKIFVEKGAPMPRRQRQGRAEQYADRQSAATDRRHHPNKTIANYWAYATTLFDFIRRAMPWPTPRTLSDNEVYALCAYLLAANKLIGKTRR